MEEELNRLKIELIRMICDLEDETILQQLIDIFEKEKEIFEKEKE